MVQGGTHLLLESITGTITMIVFLICLQCMLIAVQVCVGINGLRKGEDLFTYGYGFSIWGCIPVILIAFAVTAIT